MFKFLKEKLKDTFSNIGKKAKTKVPGEDKEKSLLNEVKEEGSIEKKVEKKGFLEKIKEKITTKKISESKFDDLFYDLELILIENNVAFEVVEKIKEDLKKELVDNPILRGKIEERIKETLKNSIKDVLNVDTVDLIKEVRKKKPYVIVFFGVNGSGKTTSIAKIAKLLMDNKLSCVLAAGDTFRAASIQQLEEHGNKLGVKVIKHNYGSDPSAVCFDAIKFAENKKIDVVLLDTAGRLHSNKNLLREMEKIVRVAKPDFKIFVGESITGNDVVSQVEEFNKTIGIDGIILTKSDVDEKGGAMISVSYITKKPVLFLGTGQGMNDLQKFDSSKILKDLGL